MTISRATDLCGRLPAFGTTLVQHPERQLAGVLVARDALLLVRAAPALGGDPRAR
jgi:hypothetical protein